MRIVAGVGELVQSTEDGHTDQVLGGQRIGRSNDVVCSLHRARGAEDCGFLGGASKPRLTVYQWFGLKTTGTVCQWFGFKTIGTVFSG
jgi:hypothetical protein